MKRIAMLAAVVALTMPSLALAQGSSTCQAYNPQLCNQVSTTAGDSASSGGTLPFTGLDVVLLVAGGGSLIAGGLVIRRLSRRLD
jgi:hypothetical protein